MNLPKEIQWVLSQLRDHSHEAFVVGGSVRDLLLGREPKDLDVATSATPEKIQEVFPDSFYTNTFGTVTVRIPSRQTNPITEVEVTTYRIDADYSDARHPDSVSFTTSLREDLSRRDFTVNAMALGDSKEAKGADEVVINDYVIIDHFGGIQDIQKKVIKAVGVPGDRFQEDALRMMRAVRFATQLEFEIEENTLSSLQDNLKGIEAVSWERIRDELVKIIMSEHPERGMNLLLSTGMLSYILPELVEGVGVGQNKHHVFTVFEHNVKSAQFAAQFNYPLHVRLAALLHDIGKPRTKRKQGSDYTFYAHDIVGARMAEKLLTRLRFPKTLVDQITHLVRYHMLYYDVDEVTEAGTRRLLARVGLDAFDDLIKLRIAERKGSGVPKALPYRLRHLQYMAEKVSQQPLSTAQLAIDGSDLMSELNIPGGPIIGGVLQALLAEVIEDPQKNTREILFARAKELSTQDPAVLKKLGGAVIRAEEKKREDDIRRKYRV